MNTRIIATGARLLLGAAIVSTSLASATASAAGHEVAVAVRLSTSGINLANPTEARRFYWRIEHAAWQVCATDVRVGLAPNDNAKECIERTLADAIRSLKAPLVTQLYLATHTLQHAAAYGIDVPAQLAAK